MVRFARAKGSKASNERLPEEATPWHEMKKQMLEAPLKKVQPIQNVSTFLEDNSSAGETTWAKFEEGKTKKKSQKKESVPIGDKIILQSIAKKKKRQFQFEVVSIGEGNKDTQDPSLETEHKPKKKKEVPRGNSVFETDLDFPGEDDDALVKAFQPKQKKKDKFMKNQGNKQSLTRREKEAVGHPITRRKDSQMKNGQFTINIGGRDVELRRFGRFAVKVEDWERLSELRKGLIKKGIPLDELKATMKLERRRAEKALARERKKVCFNCRLPGHMLSECPSVGENPFRKKDDLLDTPTTGLCFKCGSLEHTHFECKVVKNEDYKFAKCFICGEHGHISRQCPDNPNGLYPRGGGCSVCGDVTHLRKNCPAYVKEQQDSAITLPTSKKEDTLEALDEENTSAEVKPQKQKKIIKFK